MLGLVLGLDSWVKVGNLVSIGYSIYSNCPLSM